MTTDQWGIVDGYEDALGTWRETPRETRHAIRAAMGGPDQPHGTFIEAPTRIIRQGSPARIPGPAELTLEDGTTVRVNNTLPRDLPMGYHTLRPLQQGQEVFLIVSPPRCHLPQGLPTWGWASQLYALRSRESWGIGDLKDLGELARWSAGDLGAGILLLNPLGTASPVLPQEPSPYSPSSRRFRNPLYLCIEEVPGAAEAGPEIEPLACAARELNRSRKIDRNSVFHLKMEALTRLWARFSGAPEFDRYLSEQGNALRQYATFCALAEVHGGDWREWPAGYRQPDSDAVTCFATEHRDRVRFHQWVQWLLDEQLRQAANEIPLMQDLPIGFDPGGADAWVWQDVTASGVTVGAPPDEFNTQGQDWGLPPFVPHLLRAARYEPFVQTVRAALQHAGGLRIDHVMGMFQLFWVPQGMGPAKGTYVRYPAQDLLAILALESHRAGALIVGEDLGTVDKNALRQLARHWVLSYRLMWFESRRPERYPRMALAAITTHDLPTVAGLWKGSDLEAQRGLGLNPNEKGTLGIRNRLRRMTALSSDAPVRQVVQRAHQLLAQAPSLLVTATLDDALGVEERPNMPTTNASQWPNWSLALPVSLEDLKTHELVREVATALEGRSKPETDSPPDADQET